MSMPFALRSPRVQFGRSGNSSDRVTDLDKTLPAFAMIGDSITLGNTQTSSGEVNVGYWHWAQAISGFRAFGAVFAGVGGNVTWQMAARLESDVITPLLALAPSRPKYCVVMGGVNDSTNSADIISLSTDSLTSIYTDLLAAGITPIAMTVTPTTSDQTETQIANWNGINQWLLSYCPANGIPLINNIPYTLDGTFPVEDTPTWIEGGTHDGVHPTALGAILIAQPLAAYMKTILHPVQHFAPASYARRGSILGNPSMLGTAGTTGTGGSGTVADGWQVVSGAGSKAARTDGIVGEWQVLEIGATAVRLNDASGIDITSGFQMGDKVVAVAEVLCVDDWVAPTQFNLTLQFRHDSTTLDEVTFLANNPNTQTFTNPNPGGVIVMRTTPTKVPDTTNTIRVYLYLVGTSGTIRVGRFELLKLG